MKKAEFIKVIQSVDSELNEKQAAKVIDTFAAAITKALQDGESVTITGFGTFDVKERAARTGRNPKTGEAIEIAASKSPAFKAGSILKNAIK